MGVSAQPPPPPSSLLRAPTEAPAQLVHGKGLFPSFVHLEFGNLSFPFSVASTVKNGKNLSIIVLEKGALIFSHLLRYQIEIWQTVFNSFK